MKANMPFKTQPIRNMKTGMEDTKKRTPRLVNVKSYNLDALVEFALDNNYIEGAKYELAKGIVKGVIEAQRALVKMGNAVSIDAWVKYEPRLRGSVDAIKRQITGDNQIIVGVTALKELKLALDDFSFTCIDDDLKPKGEIPAIEYLYSAGHEDEHDAIYEGAAFALKGTNLATAAECELAFKDTNGKEHTVTFASADGDFAATDTLVEISDDTFFGEIRGKCAEAGSVLDTAAGVTAKLTFADGTVVTHDAAIAE